METIYPKKVLSSVPGSHDKVLNRNRDNMDQLKMASEHQLSVLDLLSDDGPSSNSQENLVHEAHVAFSVEGLGNVGTKTPVHSPQQPHRTFSYDCSLPSEVTRRSHSSKNLTSRLDDFGFLGKTQDAMMKDIDMPFYRSSLDQPFYSIGTMDSFGSSKQKLPAVKRSLQYNDKDSILKNYFGDEWIYYNSEDKNEKAWNASFTPDDIFLDEREYGLSWKNWPSHKDASSADYFNIGDHEKQGFAYEATYLQKKRASAELTGGFNILEPQSPYSKHRMPKNHIDFLTPDDTWYSAVGMNSNVRDINNHPTWSCFAAEDAKESLSLLSEESCSSSAVRGEATKEPASNSMARHSTRRHGADSRSRVNTSGVKSIYGKEAQCNLQKGTNVTGAGKCTRMSNPSSSTPAHYSTMTFQRDLSPDDNWLSEKGCTTCKLNSGSCSFCPPSRAKKNASSSCFWTEDPFFVCSSPELHDAEFSFERSKCNNPAECSPSGSFFRNKVAFCQPFNHVSSYENPIFQNIWSGSSKPNLSPFFNSDCRPQDSFRVLGCQGDGEFPNSPMQESVSKDGVKKQEILPTDNGSLELQEDACYGSNVLSSENGKSMEASASEKNGSASEEPKDRTPGMIKSLEATCSPEHAEEASSSVEMPENCEGSINENKCQNDTQTPIPFQNEYKEIEDSRPKERDIESKGQKNISADSSCQVMMLERYVLQLLCVEVLKEESAQGTAKKP